MKQHLKFILAMFFCFIFGLGWSQNNIIKINGTLRDEDTGDKIAKWLTTFEEYLLQPEIKTHTIFGLSLTAIMHTTQSMHLWLQVEVQ